MSPNLRGIVLMIAGMGAFAVEDMFIKLAAARLPTGQILMAMAGVGFVTFAVLARRRGRRLWDPAALSPAILGRNLGEMIGTFGFITAIALSPLTIATAIFQATPLAVTMGAARARRGGDPWRGALTGAAVYGAVVLAAGLLLPRINEVPADFPGDLLWRFRMAALAVQAVLWGAAGLIFGGLAARMGRPLAQAAA